MSFLAMEFGARGERVFRISIVLLTWIVSGTRLFGFSDFYSVTGVMAEPMGFETNFLSYCLLILPSVLVCALLWNCRTWMVFLLLAGIAASHNLRFPLFVGGFESYLPWVYLAGAFLPLVAPLAIFLGFTYWMAGVNKLFEFEWQSGQAVGNALGSPIFGSPVSWSVASWPGIGFMSLALPWLEILVPTLLFFGIFRRDLRIGLVTVMLLFHISIAFLLKVGDVSLACLALWPCFLFELQRGEGRSPTLKWGTRVWALVFMVFYINVPTAVIQWRQLAPPGFVFAFEHFKASRPSARWVRFFGERSGQWLEIDLATEGISPERPIEEVFASVRDSSRAWLKVLKGIDDPNQRPRAAILQNYICRHYGPTTSFGFTRFEWRLTKEYDNNFISKVVRDHGC